MKNKKLLQDLFKAYYDARRYKRNTFNALAFEIGYETKLFELYQDLINRKYQIGKSICFISFYPVKREIFAADFRDRIIHHLIYNYISPLFERLFINDTYSCRVGKGASYGIKRLNHFIRSCSDNYKRDCYILKLDIKRYFMSIDRLILYRKIERILSRFKNEIDFNFDLIMFLIAKIIFHNPVKNCVIKGTKRDWNGLPKSKSLFWAKDGRGLPIGNLTSQLFGNIYLGGLDNFVKYNLNCDYYCRYVDDMVIVHRDKEYLKFIIPVIRNYLKNKLFLELHSNKIYLQHFEKGVSFLGAIIKPYRIYIKNKTKGNFYNKIRFWNKYLTEKEGKLTKTDIQKILASVNSCLGTMKHYNTYNLRKKIIDKYFLLYFGRYFYFSPDYNKIIAEK